MISHFQPLTVPPFFYDATPVIMLNLFEQRLPLLAPPRERGGGTISELAEIIFTLAGTATNRMIGAINRYSMAGIMFYSLLQNVE